jgi:hypothetical protein
LLLFQVAKTVNGKDKYTYLFPIVVGIFMAYSKMSEEANNRTLPV